jgi:ribosomal protein S18 acetylase RimI-like enzyme
MIIKIKTAKKEDFEILLLFRLKLLEHDNKIDDRIEYTLDKIQKSSKYMKNYLKKQDNKYFLAYHNSIPIGYLHVTHDDKKNKDTSYISELYVLDVYRGRGIGKKLVKHHYTYLKRLGIKKSVLTTAKNKNKKTINFYKKLGYKTIEENKKENYVHLSKEI